MNLLIQSIFADHYKTKEVEKYYLICTETQDTWPCNKSKSRKHKPCSYSLLTRSAKGILNYDRSNPSESYTVEDFIKKNIRCCRVIMEYYLFI